MYNSSLLEHIDNLRISINSKINKDHREKYGQFFTQSSIAKFMASLFTDSYREQIKLLDPGAGIGILTAAFVNRVFADTNPPKISIDVYEIAPNILNELENTLKDCQKEYYKRGGELNWTIYNSDFLLDPNVNYAASTYPFSYERAKYTHCIMNPPYKKLSNSSKQRKMLSSVGIEVVNLYSAFVALAIQNMKKNGQLVAIIPRSFCNGVYYLAFRKYLLSRAAIRQIHLFESRISAFKDDKVLQENVIIHLEIGAEQKDVIISTSSDASMKDIENKSYPFEQILNPKDKEYFIQIPSSDEFDLITESPKLSYGLQHLGLEVSTGPVVDFRLKEYLEDEPIAGSIPLLYPSHFTKKSINWPDLKGKKPNALRVNEDTKKWLFPNGYYTIVRRFSSKEEKRRIVPYVISPDAFERYTMLGIENHLNIFHIKRGPMDKKLALGLSAYLSSLAIDKSFRKFSGHTQVNASDLKFLKYPNKDLLITIGEWVERNPDSSQEDIDTLVENYIK